MCLTARCLKAPDRVGETLTAVIVAREHVERGASGAQEHRVTLTGKTRRVGDHLVHHTMVAAVQDDHGNIRRVSGQCIRYDLPVDTDEDRRPDTVAMGGDQLVEAGSLGLAARHPHE